MLGFDMRVFRNGELVMYRDYVRVTGGDTLYSFPPHSINNLPVDPIKLLQESAIEVYCRNGYPILFTIRAGDFPLSLQVPDDEVVYIESWDQS